MPNSIDVSVIVPVYKVPDQYLIQCLDSLKNQTLDTLEVIVVDDGSPNPSTAKICDQYADSFTIIHLPNGGVSVARNTGMKAAHGKWIAFVDADDWCEPNMFASLLDTAKAAIATPDIVVSDCLVEYENRIIKNNFFPASIRWDQETKVRTLLQIFGKNRYYNPPEIAIGVPWAKLYRAEYLREQNIQFQPDLRRMQDNIFNLYAFKNANSVLYTAQPLYHYRKFGASTSNRYSPNVVNDFEKIIKASKIFLNSYEHDSRLDQGYYARIIQSVHSYMKFWIFNINNPASYSDQKRELRTILNREPYRSALKKINFSENARIVAIFDLLLRFHMFALLKFTVMQEQKTKKVQK